MRGTLGGGDMAARSETIVELKSTKAQLEVGMIYLTLRHTELHRQLERVVSQRGPGGLHQDALHQLQTKVQDYAIQIERRKIEIQELSRQIERAEQDTIENGVQQLARNNTEIVEEIANIRDEVLTLLRALAEPLRRYEELAERKTSIAHQHAALSGRDQAYTHYIEGALLRQAEYVGDVKFAIEAIKRQRVVA